MMNRLRTLKHHVRAASGAAAIALAIGGCASQAGPGRDGIGIDNAALFGKQIEEIVLPDGGTASIRLLQQRYSVKLQAFSRVVDIDRATALHFRSAQEVDGYTLIVLEKAERNCSGKTHLLAVKGAEVRQWDFGNCHDQPDVAIGSDGMSFDLAAGARTTRYLFSRGRLTYGELVARKPAQATPAPAPASPRGPAVAASAPPAPASAQASVTAAPPAAPERRIDPAGAAGAPIAAKPAPAVAKRVNTHDTLPAPTLIFNPREQAPSTLNLSH